MEIGDDWMDQYKAGPLKKLKGFWRVDGVSQVAESEKGLKVRMVLSRLKDDFADPYRIDARLGTPPKTLTLHPKWLCILTIGSVWHSGKFHSKPEPLNELLTIETTQGCNYPYQRAVKLNDAWTKAGIAAADFLPKDNYEDLYATLYTLVRIIDHPVYKWMVVPASELLRFYMGVSGRLLTAVMRGETGEFLKWPSREPHQSNRGKINLYEIKQLRRLEIEVLGRALASPTFKEEMFAVNKRITKIRATNSLGGPQSALAIDVNFPFKGVTNLSVSGQPMQLANDQAIFAMEIHHCTFPLEFSSLTVHGAGSTKTEGGEAGTQNTHQHYVVADHDPDDEDDEIDDIDTDATLQHRELAQSASPFAGSSEVNIDYDRANKERPGSGSSSPTDTPSNGLGMGDGDYKSSSKGILCVDEFKTPEHLTSSKLLEFLEMIEEFRNKTRPQGWIATSIEINGEIPIKVKRKESDQHEKDDDNAKEKITSFPPLDKRRKWNLVTSTDGVRARQLACIEVSSSVRSGRFFYILEIELKDEETGQCTAIIRGRNYQQLTPTEINKLLKLTCYLGRWPDLITDKWDKKGHRSLAAEVSQTIIVSKLIHPKNRSVWVAKLIGHINRWMKQPEPPILQE
ncbi:hypothetical protein FQZ97_446420 [compost metagenome]